MSKFWQKNGVTSVILRLRILDTTSVNGGGKTGLTNSSAGLIISTIADNEATATTYTQAGSTIDTITTLGTFAAPTTGHVRFKEVDATNFPGVYELQIADTRFAVSGARSLMISIPYVAGLGIFCAPTEVQLTAFDPQTATEPVNVTQWNGTNVSSPATAGIPDVNVKNVAGTASAGTAGYVAPDWAHINAPTTTVDLSGTTIKNVDNAIANVTTVATVTNLTNAPTSGDFTAAMKTSLNAATPAVTVSDKTGFSLSGAGVQAIWDALTANLTTAGSIGKRLVDFVTTLVYGAAPTASQNAVAVVDQALAGHTTTGTVGGQLNAIGAVTDPLLNPVPGSYAVGTAGYDISLITAVNAKLTGATVNVISPVTGNGALSLVNWVDYLVANNNQIQVSVPVTIDPTGGTVTFTFLLNTTVTPFAGTVISYDASTNTALLGLELTSADSGSLQTGQRVGEANFAVSAKSVGGYESVQIPYNLGVVTIYAAPEPAP